MAIEATAPITRMYPEDIEPGDHSQAAQTKPIPAREVAHAEVMMRRILEQFDEETSDAERVGALLPSEAARGLARLLCERLVSMHAGHALDVRIYVSFTPAGGIHIGLYSGEGNGRSWFSVDPAGRSVALLTGVDGENRT